jgi:hypothetical protein
MDLEDSLMLKLKTMLPDLDEKKREELLSAVISVTKSNKEGNSIVDLLDYLGYNEHDVATKILIAYVALGRLISSYPVLQEGFKELLDEKVNGLTLSTLDCMHLASKCVDWRFKQRGGNPHINELLQSLEEEKAAEITPPSKDIQELDVSDLPIELKDEP